MLYRLLLRPDSGQRRHGWRIAQMSRERNPNKKLGSGHNRTDAESLRDEVVAELARRIAAGLLRIIFRHRTLGFCLNSSQ